MERKQETGLAVVFEPAVITADFEAMHRKLDKLLEDYDGMTEEALAKLPAKELKPLRADLNAKSKELNDARIAVKKQYEAPLKEFEAKVKELDERIKEPCRMIDEAIKAKERSAKQEKLGLLELSYRDFCEANGVEALQECVPFELILEPSWLNASFGLVKAKKELDEKLTEVLRDYQTVRDGNWFDKDAALQTFFETLSTSEAMRRDIANKEAAEKREALIAQIEGNRNGYPSDGETGSQKGSESLRRYSFVISCTEGQKDELVEWFKARGIRGTFKKGEGNEQD